MSLSKDMVGWAYSRKDICYSLPCSRSCQSIYLFCATTLMGREVFRREGARRETAASEVQYLVGSRALGRRFCAATPHFSAQASNKDAFIGAKTQIMTRFESPKVRRT